LPLPAKSISGQPESNDEPGEARCHISIPSYSTFLRVEITSFHPLPKKGAWPLFWMSCCLCGSNPIPTVLFRFAKQNETAGTMGVTHYAHPLELGLSSRPQREPAAIRSTLLFLVISKKIAFDNNFGAIFSGI